MLQHYHLKLKHAHDKLETDTDGHRFEHKSWEEWDVTGCAHDEAKSVAQEWRRNG